MTIDHVARAPDNLAGKIRDLDRARGLARAWATAVDWAEGEGPAIAAGSLDVDQAVGAQLRRLARLVGAPEVADDDAQRALVRAQLLAIRSRGTGDDLLGVLDALWPGEATLEEHFPAGQLLGSPHDVGADFAAVAGRLLARARSAAVYTQLHHSPAPEAETFRLAPAWGVPDAVLDDPGAAQLAQLDAAVGSAAPGATPTHAWFGALADAVSGALLTASGGAAHGVATGSPARSLARLGLGYTGAVNQRHVAPAGVGQIEDAADSAVVVVFWAGSLPRVDTIVAGTRDFSIPLFSGWSIRLIGNTETIRIELGSTVGLARSTDLTGQLRRGYNAVVISSDRAADEVLASAGGAEGSMDVSGLSFVGTGDLMVGHALPGTVIRAISGQVPVVAAYDRKLPAQDVAVAVLEALHGSAPSSSRGLSDEATRTQGGRLSGVLVL